jgi:hypothetical protein
MGLKPLLRLGIALATFGGCVHERAEGRELPRVVLQAREALGRGGDLPESLLSFPVNVVEVAYEVGPGWCAAHHRVTVVGTRAALRPLLEGLARAWATGPPVSLASSPGFWGVVSVEDCEHVWAVGIDPGSERINSIIIDTPESRGGNSWTPGPFR